MTSCSLSSRLFSSLLISMWCWLNAAITALSVSLCFHTLDRLIKASHGWWQATHFERAPLLIALKNNISVRPSFPSDPYNDCRPPAYQDDLVTCYAFFILERRMPSGKQLCPRMSPTRHDGPLTNKSFTCWHPYHSFFFRQGSKWNGSLFPRSSVANERCAASRNLLAPWILHWQQHWVMANAFYCTALSLTPRSFSLSIHATANCFPRLCRPASSCHYRAASCRRGLNPPSPSLRILAFGNPISSILLFISFSACLCVFQLKWCLLKGWMNLQSTGSSS